MNKTNRPKDCSSECSNGAENPSAPRYTPQQLRQEVMKRVNEARRIETTRHIMPDGTPLKQVQRRLDFTGQSREVETVHTICTATGCGCPLTGDMSNYILSPHGNYFCRKHAVSCAKCKKIYGILELEVVGAARFCQSCQRWAWWKFVFTRIWAYWLRCLDWMGR